MSQIMMTEYPFPTDLEDRSYCVFPDELEQDDLVLFHGTPLENLASIRGNGFRLPRPDDNNPLTGVSFARKSSLAFSHAMNKRKSHLGDYCIIAVRYMSMDFPHIVNDGAGIVHDYKLDPLPQCVGFCIVPESYQFD